VSRKSRPPFSVPAWYAKASPERRAARTANIRADLKLVRRYREGFTPSDGYDGRDVRRLNPQRLAKLTRAAGDLRRRLTVPHVVKRVPRTEKTVRQRLAQLAPQGARAVSVKQFIVPVVDPARSRIVIRNRRVEVQRDYAGQVLTDRYFLLPRIRVRVGFDDVIRATEKLLREMPDGHYGVIMDQHGLAGPSADKERLVPMLRSWAAEYSGIAGKRGTAGAVVGFVRIGDSAYDANLTELRRARRTVVQQMSENIERERWARERKASRALTRRQRLKGR
jgi:hypothetical protein